MPPSTPPNTAAATPWSNTALGGRPTARSRWRARLLYFGAFSLREPAFTALESALVRSQFAIKLVLGHDPVPAVSLGEVERAIASLNQIRHRLAELKLSNANGNRDAGKKLPGRAAGDATLGDQAAYPLGNRGAGGKVGARKHRDQFFPAVSGGQIVFPQPFPQDVGHQPKHLVAYPVSKTVVEFL